MLTAVRENGHRDHGDGSRRPVDGVLTTEHDLRVAMV